MKPALFCAAFAATVAMAAASAAQAEEAEMHVKLGDLNLSTAAGARVALARIQAGADAFCDIGAGRQSLERVALQNRCVAQMVRKGVDHLQAPLVTALWSGQPVSGQPGPAVALAEK